MTDIIKIPVEIRDGHKFVTISIDIFFINKIIVFITLSRKICFTMVTHLSNRKVDTIFKVFKDVFKYYYQRGFQLMTITEDGEFVPLVNGGLARSTAVEFNCSQQT
jgi:hypothetical protein